MATRSPTPRREGSAPTFSIRLAAEMSGLTEETLRAWERRHGWPRPERAPGGSRLYSRDDIARLRRVRRALDRGFRPGALLGRSDDEIDAMLVDASGEPAPAATAPSLDALFEAVAAEDALTLQSLLRAALLLLGPKRFVVDVAQPASLRVGELWASGDLEVRHEHLLTAALEAQLNVALATLDIPRSAPAALLTTLPGGTHTLGLDMIAVYVAARGVSPRRLGPETPPDQIVAAARTQRARVIGIAITPPHDLDVTRAGLAAIARGLRRATMDVRPEVWVGGAGAADLRAHRSIRVVPDWPTLDRLVDALLR